FDKEVLLEDHSFAERRTQRSENTGGLAEILPSPRQRDRLHVGDRLDLVTVSECAVKPERRSPIMQHERDVSGEAERIEPRVEVTRMIHKPVSLRRRFSGPAHPDQIGGKAPCLVADMRDDVAPQIGIGRVAMEEDNWVAGPRVDEAHLCVANVDALSWMRVGWLVSNVEHCGYL